jgi:hypothetical protein
MHEVSREAVSSEKTDSLPVPDSLLSCGGWDGAVIVCKTEGPADKQHATARLKPPEGQVGCPKHGQLSQRAKPSNFHTRTRYLTSKPPHVCFCENK